MNLTKKDYDDIRHTLNELSNICAMASEQFSNLAKYFYPEDEEVEEDW